MGVDTTISLPPHVRVNDVAKVLGRLLGQPVSMRSLGIRGSLAEAADVEDVQVVTTYHPNMCGINIAKRAFYYHFEGTGGRRSILLSSMAGNIALLCGLANVFGGSVDYNDCDSNPQDHVVPDKPWTEVAPDDGVAWQTWQYTIRDVVPLTAADVQRYEQYASYHCEG